MDLINDGSIRLVKVFTIGIFFCPSDNEIYNDCELEFHIFHLVLLFCVLEK